MPSLESEFPRNQFVRVAEGERPGKDRGIVRVAKARQSGSDALGHRMVPFAMPTDNLLGLLFEIIEAKHGRPPEFLNFSEGVALSVYCRRARMRASYLTTRVSGLPPLGQVE